MTDVAVIRPGCTDYDSQSRIAGRLDLPLNAAGEAQNAELIDTPSAGCTSLTCSAGPAGTSRRRRRRSATGSTCR